MTNIVEKTVEQKVGKLTILDGALIGASKLSTELLMSRLSFVGNGTARSGLIKLALSLGVSMLAPQNSKMGKATSIITTGVLLDGMEDLALVLRRRLTKTEEQSAGNGEVPAFA